MMPKISYIVNDSTGCWEWTSVIREGYGRIWVNNRYESAHRYIYEQLRHRIPPGYVTHHTCRNTRCVNPEHIHPMPHRYNVYLGTGITAERHRKTHCYRGHEFTPENTYVDPSGSRKCRECKRRGRG